MLRTVFMGSPDLASVILDKLCTGYGPPELVVTQSAKAKGRGQKVLPTPVQAYAEQKGIRAMATDNANEPAVVEALRNAQPDLVLVAAFGQLLKNDILTLPKLYCLNVHASLLPEYRGASPIQQAIWDGKQQTGITIQRMVKKLDAGDILLQRKTPIGPAETSGELMQRLAVLGGECLVDAVKLVESGQGELTPQDPSRVTYAGKIEKEQARIDWSQTADRIVNQVRALNPWPIAETTLNGERLKIHAARLADKPASAEPGTLHTDGRSELVVSCGSGTAVALTAVQAENRKRLEIREFLAAFRGNFPYRKLGA
jgi:methionyl-tRNA formyltransferase